MIFIVLPTGSIVAKAEGLTPDDFYAYWKLDDVSGSTAADSSGNGRTVTLYNEPVWQTVQDSVYGGSLSFNGTNQYGSAELDLSDTDSVTISFWMNTDSYTDDDKLAFEFGAGGG